MISIHALRVEGDNVAIDDRHCARISIHALRVEGDAADGATSQAETISIHALRVEGDDSVTRAEWADAGQFLSTPSGWRATNICF